MDTAAPVRQELLRQLLSLSFPAFAACVADLLQAMGYTDIRLAGRSGRKGKNRDGGYDLEAVAPNGLSRRHVIAQIKQFTPGQKVHQRTLDELRGAALRVGAAEAFLVTTGTFSYVVQDLLAAAAAKVGISRVLSTQGIDGTHLIDLLLRYGIGVTAEGRVDSAYFASRADAQRVHGTSKVKAATPKTSGARGGGQGRRRVHGRQHAFPAGLVIQVTLPLLLGIVDVREPEGRASQQS